MIEVASWAKLSSIRATKNVVKTERLHWNGIR